MVVQTAENKEVKQHAEDAGEECIKKLKLLGPDMSPEILHRIQHHLLEAMKSKGPGDPYAGRD